MADYFYSLDALLWRCCATYRGDFLIFGRAILALENENNQ